ncbi:MAG: alpha-1,2-fucosyltransferase [Afipia sp.]
MIRVSLFGGLGNQMFQYAAGKALAKRHGVKLGFDLGGFRVDQLRSFLLDRLRVPETVRGGDEIPTSTEPGSYFFRARRRQRVERAMALIGLPRLRSSRNSYREPHFHFDPAFHSLGPDTELFGYFQSELYFGSIADDVRRHFEPREPLGTEARVAADRIARSELPVSVHVRRGDYVRAATAAVHGLLEANYYRKALAQIEDRVGRSPDLFVFSDDHAAAARVLDFVSPARVTYVQGDPDRPWEDMTLIASCHHHVIANSSFSWWGAWLNQSPDKIVIAPRSWFTQKGLLTRDTRDLYPSGWIQV